MVALDIWRSIGMLWRTCYVTVQRSDNSPNNAEKYVVAVFSYFSEMSTNRVFSAIRCRRIGLLFAIKFHRNICVDSSTSTNWDVYESGQMLCRFVDIDESGCLQIGTNVVSIRRHRRIGLSTNRDKCGVDSSTSTNRDVYQCGYLRIDLLPYGSIIPRHKDFLFTSMFYVPSLAMAVGSGNCCLKCRATLFIDRRGARIGCH